jgi:hypothetical protein
MAFQPNAAAASNSQTNEAWKAQGFLNLYLPSKDGKRIKLGAIPLKERKSNEKKLLDWLNEDPSNAEVLLSKMEIEYRSATQTEGAGFDLD